MLLWAHCCMRGNSEEHPHTMMMPRAPTPSGTQPKPKPHPESSSCPRQPQGLLGLHWTFPLGCSGALHPVKMLHERHGDSRPCPDPAPSCPSTSSLARRASSARCLMASRSSRQLRSLPGTLSSTAPHLDTRALTCSRCERGQHQEAPAVADGCRVCWQRQHLPKPRGKGGITSWVRAACSSCKL